MADVACVACGGSLLELDNRAQSEGCVFGSDRFTVAPLPVGASVKGPGHLVGGGLPLLRKVRLQLQRLQVVGDKGRVDGGVGAVFALQAGEGVERARCTSDAKPEGPSWLRCHARLCSARAGSACRVGTAFFAPARDCGQRQDDRPRQDACDSHSELHCEFPRDRYMGPTSFSACSTRVPCRLTCLRHASEGSRAWQGPYRAEPAAHPV